MPDSSQSSIFKLGLIVNPLAGVGGAVGLKGSDGAATVREALARGAEARAPVRAERALGALQPLRERLQVFCYAGDMGETEARAAGLKVELVGAPAGAQAGEQTTAADTEAAARALVAEGVDLILFVGGDGTARNIVNAVDTTQPVLGVPAGVKMHSGVYAVSPEAAGEIVRMLILGELVTIAEQEVRDIDEDAFRQGIVKAKYYGELSVPEEGHFLQQVKNGGREVEELVLADIAADVIENMDEDTLYIMGPGSTTRAVMEELGLDNTLLGVDLVRDQQLLASDVTGPELEAALEAHSGPVRAVITAIGGQGHIIGRGNQQLTPKVLQRLGREGLWVIATKSKILELEGRPLLVDSHDLALDRALQGYIQVTTGYRDAIMYPVGYRALAASQPTPGLGDKTPGQEGKVQ